ncbi:MAG TPA: tetratricopeptide repeat protein [Candidatus Vogelbacteria bacterium]|nr:tetratricopeptide repeat protein [Candidatus Vogelbacteria bacterium]
MLTIESIIIINMEDNNINETNSNSNDNSILTIGSGLSISLLSAMAILLPIFFLPFLGINLLGQSKNIFFLTIISLAVIFWLIDLLMIGKISFPHHKLFYLTLYLPLFFVIPLVFSGSFFRSLISINQQYDTFIFILGLLLTFVLFGLLFQDHKRQLNFYLSFLIVAILAGTYQLLRFSLVPFWSESFIWNYLPISLVGGWLESGAYFGLNLLLLVFFWKFIKLNNLSKIFKILLWLGFLIFLANLFLINFYIVWILLLIFSVILLLLSLRDHYSKLDVHDSLFLKSNYPSIIVLITSIFFVLFGNEGGWLHDGVLRLYSLAGFSFLDFRPGFFYTWQTYLNIWQEDIIYGLFGVGLNNFHYAWNNWRPAEVASLDNFWLFSFNGGNSILMSFLITSGLVGFLALLVWLLMALYYYFKNIISIRNVSRERLLLSGLWFLGVVYLWFFNIFYFYCGVLWVLSFVFAGLMATIIFSNSPKIKFDFSKRPELRTAITFICFLLIIAFGFGSFTFSRYLVSSYNFEMSTKSLSKGEYFEVEEYLNKAVSYSQQAEYYKNLSENSLRRLDKQLAEFTTEEMKKYEREIISNLEKSIRYAQRAVRLEKNNYIYHVSLGRVYERFMFLAMGAGENVSRDAYGIAKQSYQTAISLAKARPDIYLELARLELLVDNLEAAKDSLEKAIEMKPNYHQAYIWLAQVLDRQGELPKAVDIVNISLNIKPSDPSSYFIARYLQYRLNNYNRAIELLDRSMDLSGGFNPNSAYYLGLSYDRLGRRTEALRLFKRLAETNPQNEEIRAIINNLRAGRSALYNVSEAELDLLKKENDDLQIGDEEIIEEQ